MPAARRPCVAAWRSQVLRLPPLQSSAVLHRVERPVLVDVVPHGALQLVHVVLALGNLAEKAGQQVALLVLFSHAV